ncbi:MAG: hypothetical protein ACOWWH_12675 [Eubacteriaceae bacterium]
MGAFDNDLREMYSDIYKKQDQDKKTINNYELGYLTACIDDAIFSLNYHTKKNRFTLDPVVIFEFRDERSSLRLSNILKNNGIKHSVKIGYSAYNSKDVRIVVNSIPNIFSMFNFIGNQIFSERHLILREYINQRIDKLKENGKARYDDTDLYYFNKLDNKSKKRECKITTKKL